jgi:hypothetical protein
MILKYFTLVFPENVFPKLLSTNYLFYFIQFLITWVTLKLFPVSIKLWNKIAITLKKFSLHELIKSIFFRNLIQNKENSQLSSYAICYNFIFNLIQIKFNCFKPCDVFLRSVTRSSFDVSTYQWCSKI